MPQEQKPTITEDDPRWDCRTMGNRVCGPSKSSRAKALRIYEEGRKPFKGVRGGLRGMRRSSRGR